MDRIYYNPFGLSTQFFKGWWFSLSLYPTKVDLLPMRMLKTLLRWVKIFRVLLETFLCARIFLVISQIEQKKTILFGRPFAVCRLGRKENFIFGDFVWFHFLLLDIAKSDDFLSVVSWNCASMFHRQIHDL